MKAMNTCMFLKQIQMQVSLGELLTMKMIIQASIFHVIVEEEVSNGGHGVAAESDKVAVLDIPQRLQLRLKFVDILCKLVVQLLDCNGMAILKGTPVNRT